MSLPIDACLQIFDLDAGPGVYNRKHIGVIMMGTRGLWTDRFHLRSIKMLPPTVCASGE